MEDERIEIYSGRLDATVSEVVHYLDNELNSKQTRILLDRFGNPTLDHLPDAGFFTRAYSIHKGTPRSVMDKEWQEAMASPKTGVLYIRRFWEGNKWIHVGVNFMSLGPFGRNEFYSGHIELTQVYPKKEKPTDIVIVSDWPTLRAYWEWVTRQIRRDFKERGKGGPRETPIEKRIQFVLGWRQVMGNMRQHDYCNNNPFQIVVTPRMLQIWERDLEERGLILKRKR